MLEKTVFEEHTHGSMGLRIDQDALYEGLQYYIQVGTLPTATKVTLVGTATQSIPQSSMGWGKTRLRTTIKVGIRVDHAHLMGGRHENIQKRRGKPRKMGLLNMVIYY